MRLPSKAVPALILQPPPLAPGLKVALRHRMRIDGDNLTGTRDVEQMGMKLVEEVEPFTNLKNTAALAQRRRSSIDGRCSHAQGAASQQSRARAQVTASSERGFCCRSGQCEWLPEEPP